MFMTSQCVSTGRCCGFDDVHIRSADRVCGNRSDLPGSLHSRCRLRCESLAAMIAANSAAFCTYE